MRCRQTAPGIVGSLLVACGADVAGDADAVTYPTEDASVDMSGDAGAQGADGSGAPLVVYTETRAPCADRSASRNLYWGDLHIHTAYSFDAYINEVRAYPRDAYAFARGEPLAVPPSDTPARLAAPLDFAAVTDHAEYLAETRACNDPESSAYATATCVRVRDASSGTFTYGAQLQAMEPARFADVCTAIDCAVEEEGVWTAIQRAAEEAYDRSSTCTFTSFVAYEYTSARNVSNLHRNVVFRNASVPAAPVSYFDDVSPWGLWRRLRDDCRPENGCGVIAIPHNSNMSDGRMFVPEYPDGDQVELARFRGEMEPLVEIFQHKSASECVRSLASSGVGEDELCDFENISLEPHRDCGDDVGAGGMAGLGCLSRYSFVRYALEAGLLEEGRLGVNPYRLGIIASTDTHNGTSGAVVESDFRGHVGVDDGTPATRLAPPGLLPGGITTNPGGLTGVWAVENSRDALFEAFLRREVFGTSGPRISIRLFAGSELPADLCARPDLVREGYARGVPMGGALSGGGAGALRVAVSALRDPASTGALERIQIVKGWIDDGRIRERVFDIAVAPELGGVDEADCTAAPGGAPTLCAVWEDPAFDPSQRSFYYARVVETPTCRWSWRQCLGIPEPERPRGCRDARIPRVIRERAWSSPVWYSPE